MTKKGVEFVGYAFTLQLNDISDPPPIDLTALLGGSGTAPQPGDYVLVAGGFPDYAQDAGVSSGGWTELYQSTVGENPAHQLSISSKFMGAVPDTTIAMKGSGSFNEPEAYLAYVFRNVDPNSPLDTSLVIAQGGGTTPSSPAIVTITPNALVIPLVAGDNSCSPVGPAGYTQPKFVNANETDDSVISMAFKKSPTVGLVTPPSWSAVASGGVTVATIALRARGEQFETNIGMGRQKRFLGVH